MRTMLRLMTLSLLLAPGVSRAYYLETRGEAGEAIRYADGDEATPAIDVTYRIDPSTFPPELTGGEEAIDAAFATWSGAECGNLAFTKGASSDASDRSHWTSDGGEIYVLVYFTAADEEWTSGPSVGHFFFGYDPTGALIGATVVLNARDHSWATDGSPDSLDLQSVVTALIGRSLGITSATEGNATYPSYAPGDVSKRELGDDDLAALAFLYPTGGDACAAPAEPEALCDGFATDCPPRPTTNPGDGGTHSVSHDAGPVQSDAGVPLGDDPGMGDVSAGGCSVAAGVRSPSAGFALALFGLALFLRRRR